MGDNLNRAILLTPPGVAAIAVVRLAGPATKAFLARHFSRPLRAGRAVHGILRDDPGEEIDDPVVALSANERFADINLHGGAWVVQAVMQLATQAGFQRIEKLDLPLPDEAIDADSPIDREIHAYLPLASTDLALRTLLAQSAAWETLESQIKLRSRDALQAILSDRSLHWLLHPPRVAIVGAANVGKSTLANRLFAQERSITADVPGTTRDWVGEMANLNGLAVQLVDTPGIRDTHDPIEREAINRSQTQITRADLVVLVLDASRALLPEQAPLIRRFPQAIRVINKSDAVAKWMGSGMEAIQTVATTGAGIDPLMRQIRAAFGCQPIDPATPRCWTQRQRDWLLRHVSGA